MPEYNHRYRVYGRNVYGEKVKLREVVARDRDHLVFLVNKANIAVTKAVDLGRTKREATPV